MSHLRGFEKPDYMSRVEQLKVGEAIEVPGKTARVMSGYVKHWKRKTGFRFATCRTEMGCQIKRVE